MLTQIFKYLFNPKKMSDNQYSDNQQSISSNSQSQKDYQDQDIQQQQQQDSFQHYNNDRQNDDNIKTDDELFEIMLHQNQQYQNSNKQKEVMELVGGNRITMNLLTKYQMARVIGLRAQHIGNNAALYISKEELDMMENKNPNDIAFQELKRGVIPFIIRRYHPNQTQYEDWKLSELQFKVESVIYNRNIKNI